MDYASWSETVIEQLISAGMDSQLVRKVFNGNKAELEANYNGGVGEPTLIGVHLLNVLETHDVDLQIAMGRGRGESLSALAITHFLTTQEVRHRAVVGATKRAVILGGLRGEVVDPNASLDF